MNTDVNCAADQITQDYSSGLTEIKTKQIMSFFLKSNIKETLGGTAALLALLAWPTHNQQRISIISITNPLPAIH